MLLKIVRYRERQSLKIVVVLEKRLLIMSKVVSMQ